MKTDAQVLDDALKLVESDEKWTKGTFCRNAEGTAVGFYHTSDEDEVLGRWRPVIDDVVPGTDYTPVSFCLEGAIRHAAGMNTLEMGDKVAVVRQVARLEFLVAKVGLRMLQERKPNLPFRPSAAVLHLFNDVQETSYDDAILALKTARAELE